MRILAVDPGGTSGWAETTVENPIGDLTYGQLEPSAMAAHLRAFVNGAHSEDRRLVMERFSITAHTARKTPQLDALELIGLGKYLAEWHDVAFVLQDPADAKAFAHNAALRRWGIWVPVQDHARDAVRHLVYALARQHQIFL